MNSDLDMMVSRPIILRIDNLPPGKNWKQIKYLIGGIIHHSNVLKVKLLPLMTSLVPPFIPFQSCIVSLKSTLDNESLHDLLLELNTYQWDYYNLYAYTLPPPPVHQQPSSGTETSSENEFSTSNGNTPKVQNNSFIYPMPLPSTMPNGMPTGMPGMVPSAMMNAPQMQASGSMPPQPMMSLPTQRRRYYQPPIQPFNPRTSFNSGVNQMRNKSGSTSAYSYYPMSTQDISSNNDSLKSTLKQNNGYGNSNTNNSRGLKQIFNEKSFRKQMTGRGMWQLQLENFPPFLKLETLESLNEQEEIRLTEKGVQSIETSQPDKFGRLRWTILKDFIKLKCPKLLNLQEKSQSQSDTSQDVVNANNTREFYVGVYEDDEMQIRLNIITKNNLDDSNKTQYIDRDDQDATQDEGKHSDDTQDSEDSNDTRESKESDDTHESKDSNYTREFKDFNDTQDSKDSKHIQKNAVNAVIYKAIVGFNDKELCDMCFENLLDQEYSLGYRLKVQHLPPFEEDKRNSSGDTQRKIETRY